MITKELWLLVVALAAIIGMFVVSMGCDTAKERAAILTCAKSGGLESYKPRLKELVVTCKDGTVHAVKWLP